MNIIIVGCGKVGRELAAQLSKDNNDVTVVDINPDLVRNVSTLYDVMGVTGNGTSFEVLAQAGVDHADVLIAVTRSDEVNLLCCVIARKATKCFTIARVSNPVYSREYKYLSKELGISMIYNPAYGAAREIASLFRFPSALDIFTFAKNKADLVRFRVPINSPLKGTALKNIPSMIADKLLICIAERDKKIIIPDGDYVISAGDILSVVTYPEQMDAVFANLGLRTDHIKNVLIVGGSKITYPLVHMLTDQNMKVTIIEKNPQRAEELAELLPEATVLCGDGTDLAFLREEHLTRMDALLASTSNDEENIILSLFSRDMVRYKIVTKVDHLDDAAVIDRLDLDSLVSPKLIMTEMILKHVRAMGNSQGSNVERLYKMADGSVEALEFYIQEGSPVANVRLSKLQLKPPVLVAGIVRDGNLILPTGMDEIKAGDSVIIVTSIQGFRDVKDILK
ncbi:MAG: Trk system potassium transporter TrkA [Lachnospiraceae bacterium]|nr:Trk system potassium transporter TrkA [Lachnospiraceae bacterium]